jgi:uncharacterized repeat protein (TIGR03843 family)
VRDLPHELPTADAMPDAAARRLLREGTIEVLGRMPWSTNTTLLAHVSGDDGEMVAIYKPQRGERPLWDFPRGTLCYREVAAFEVSEALGWHLVPDTTLRDGPLGLGMVQRFVPHDPDEHYFTLQDAHADELRRMALFDIVVNNTDRKGGHCLRAGHDGSIFGIDHGVSFHAQWKVRTVIWDFAGEPIPPDACAALRSLRQQLDGALGDRLRELLDRFELDAVGARIEHLLARGELPAPDGDYHCYPWPLV